MSRRARERRPRAPGAAQAARRQGDAAWFALALLPLAAVLAAGYAHTLPFAFHFDDFSNIRDNPSLRPPLDWAAIWAFRPSRCVLDASLALNRALTGPGPAGFRAVNLLVHLAAAMLVGWIARELARRHPYAGAPEGARTAGLAAPDAIGVLAALVFVAHPLATQAVTYVIQRTASLCALFELASVALSLAARRSGRRAAWAGAWTAGLLAAFTKEMSVALPVLLLLVHAWPAPEAGPDAAARGRASRVPWWLLSPFALVPALVAWSGQLVSAKLGYAVTGLRETADISRVSYFLTQLTVIPRYLALALLPRGQNLDPDVLLRVRPDGPVLAGALLLLALTVAALRVRRAAPLAALGWLWFLAALAPESSLFPIRDPMVEHRTYLPLAGLAWAVAETLVMRVPRPGARALLAVTLVGTLATVTHVRNLVWRDEVTLWRDVVSKSPRRARGWNDLAMALEEQGRPGEAESCYRRAIAVDSTYVFARSNLGRLYGMQGRLEESLRMLQAAVRLSPHYAEALNNLGVTWCALGDTSRALSEYRAAIQADPRDTQARVNLVRLRQRLVDEHGARRLAPEP